MRPTPARPFAPLGLTLFFCISLPAAGCQTPSEPPAFANVEERRLRPSEVNPRVTRFDDHHLIWVRTSDRPLTGTLLVLFAGTGGVPANARWIGQTAADQGYHVIGLNYPSDRAILAFCTTDPTPDCMGRMRTEILTGEAVSPHVEVDRDDSIDGRLTDLLVVLHERYPDEGWGTFLSSGSPRWSRIAVGGLSQGGGHAAYIATLREVPRVLMFGAPADGLNGLIAHWMEPGATPSERYFGFRHLRDPFLSIDPNWRALGMATFGAPVQVESSAPPYGGSHMLVTDLLPRNGSYGAAHPSVYGDAMTPIDEHGTPRFLAAWRYLIGSPFP